MEELTLSGRDLYDLMGSFLTRGQEFQMKIQCTGASMSPFIRDKNIVTITPRSRIPSLKNGDIVAAAVHEKKRIIIHRIIAVNPPAYKLKGDNNGTCDGWFHETDILGVVERVETLKGVGYTPRHWQNIIIAVSSRVNILKYAFLPFLKFLKT